MFLPRRWSLPDPALIWQLSETLLQALSIHAREHKKVLPREQALDCAGNPGKQASPGRRAHQLSRS